MTPERTRSSASQRNLGLLPEHIHAVADLLRRPHRPCTCETMIETILSYRIANGGNRLCIFNRLLVSCRQNYLLDLCVPNKRVENAHRSTDRND
jgi:hypothetical protein